MGSLKHSVNSEFTRDITIDGKTVKARMGCCHWRDAMIVTKSCGEFQKLPDCISLGFVFNHENVTYVVHNFSDGEIDDYTALPTAWCVSVYYFRK